MAISYKSEVYLEDVCLASHFQSVSLLVVSDWVKWPEDLAFVQQ